MTDVGFSINSKFLCHRYTSDQNNLMTMANARLYLHIMIFKPLTSFTRLFSRLCIPNLTLLQCLLESQTHCLLVTFLHLYSLVSTILLMNKIKGAIIGQIIVGLICDRIGRKVALVSTTALIVLGATLATAAHGAGGSAVGLFWFLTIAR